MPKVAGKEVRIYVDGYDISGDNASFDATLSLADLDVTGFGKNAHQRIVGHQDHTITTRGHWDDTALVGLDAVYSAMLGSNSNVITVLFDEFVDDYEGSADAFTLRGQLQTNYTVASNVDGKIDANGTFISDNSVDVRQKVLRAKNNITAAFDGTGMDIEGWTSAVGLSAVLHVFAFTGTSATVEIEDSPDGSAWATALAFTPATARGVERVETADDEAIDDHLRITVAGTFSSFTFAVVAKKGIVTP